MGTAFKQGNGMLLEKFKYEVAKNTTNGIPTDWKNNYFERSGESLVTLKQYKIDIIRSQGRMDWSKQILVGAKLEYLDQEAINLAKMKYKEKMNDSYIASEVDRMTDEQFLTKAKLIFDGKITQSCMLLLGKSDYDYLFQTPPTIMWRLYSGDGTNKDYEIFKIPFINVVDKVFSKVRNLTYRYMPNQMTLFPVETEQYNGWLMRELLNNSIVHANYQLGGRIYVNEFEDKIKITNPGDFIPQKIEKVLEVSYNPPFYRNQLLAESMVMFHMIDTATLGIRRAYNIQKAKYFPLPDYQISSGTQVDVTVYGRTLNDSYMHILYERQDLDLQIVYLLDKVQKGLLLEKKEVEKLRLLKLVEGRATNLYLSSTVAKTVDDTVGYIKNKGFDDQYYKDLILKYLKQYKTAKKREIKELLWTKLPDVLSDQQKENKIKNLLTALKKQGKIDTDSANQQKSAWIIKQDLNKVV